MYYWDVDGMGKDRLFHSCHRGERQMVPTSSEVDKSGYYEDGYFRGMKAGRFSKMFAGSPFSYGIRVCKACGEEVHH